MITSRQNVACLSLANEADAIPSWNHYAQYCRLREQGLRKQAFASLELFLSEALLWDFEDQKSFVLWLCGKMDSVEDADYGPFPTPLRDRLFQPFFTEWLRREPRNDEACALRGRYLREPDFYYRAIEINPRNQRARLALAVGCIGDIAYAAHHLPHYFIGDEQKVKAVAEEARVHITHLDELARQTRLLKGLAHEEQLLDDWIAFQQERDGDFDAWCRRKGREYSWVSAYYYE